MKISLNWLNDYVDLRGLNIKDLWYRFTMSTAEVDDVIEMGKDINNVVAGRIVRVDPHPDSRKLKIVQVDTGDGIVQSICGAPNVREDIYVPFAKVGGSLKKIPKVGKAMVSGVESSGIICSAAEIGISDNHEGILVLPENCKTGANIKEIIDIDDIIIEVDNKSLTNRPDLWGHYGIAREFAAIFQRKLRPIDVDELEDAKNLYPLDIDIVDGQKCFRYSSICIEGINAGFTPFKMQVRLYYCGMRPISPLVDITNYLMLETGQPMHAFDKRHIQKIVVKSTDKPISFVTLDGVDRKIPEDVLMICNGDKPAAIAGIMGGENSEIADDTDSIILESANFEGYSTRKSGTRIGLRTEASSRFEKMLDPELTVLSIKRFVKLLKDMQPDIKMASSLTDVYCKKNKDIVITIDKPYIDKYIGNIIDSGKVADILRSLEFGVRQDGEVFTVTVPSYRATKDISMKADLIEEISRIYGYDNIIPKTIDIPIEPLKYNEQRLVEHKIREILAEKFNYNEVNSYVWYDNTFNKNAGIGYRNNIKILNPNAKDMDTLRDSLVPVMLEYAERNSKSFDEFYIFEIGSAFKSGVSDGKCMEDKTLCLLTASKVKDEDTLFYNLKGISKYLLNLLKNIECSYKKAEENTGYQWIHPVKSIHVECDGIMLGYISVIHPQIRQNIDKKLNIAVFELNLTELDKIKQKEMKYKEPSKYPEVTLDFNFLADSSIPFEKINMDISEFKSDILTDYSFIDKYTGKGLPDDKKSMTFRFNIGSREKTLSSEEINMFSDDIIKYMQSKGYFLR